MRENFTLIFTSSRDRSVFLNMYGKNKFLQQLFRGTEIHHHLLPPHTNPPNFFGTTAFKEYIWDIQSKLYNSMHKLIRRPLCGTIVALNFNQQFPRDNPGVKNNSNALPRVHNHTRDLSQVPHPSDWCFMLRDMGNQHLETQVSGQ